MGIDNLNAFLKDNNIFAHGEIDLSEFREKRIVIDASYIFCTWLAQAGKQVVSHIDFHNPVTPMDRFLSSIMRSAQKFLTDLLSQRIFPIFIHDAEAPEAKRITLEKRRVEKAGCNEKYRNLLQAYQRCEPMSRGNKLEELRKAYLRSSFLSSEQYTQLFKQAFSYGVPHATVLNGVDGERLAATLVREGHAAAVWTTDTDVLVHGATAMITGFVTSGRVKITYLAPILQFFGNNRIYFRDFCILLGCDYNIHIHGIGPKKAFVLFQQFQGNIDAIAYQYAADNLNIEVCRRLFEDVPWTDLVDTSTLSLSFEVDKLPVSLRSFVTA